MNRIDIIHNKMKNMKCAALAVLVFSFVAHGYRFSNNMYSHDALLMIYQNDYAWQVALGRFIQPLLIFLRGSLCNPWLICLTAILFQTLSVYLITDTLKIESKTGKILTAGVFVCNATVISTNSAYLPWADFYAVSCFLSIFAVWCMKKTETDKKQNVFWRVLGIFSLVGSLGIYQAYLSMALGLVLLEIFSLLMQKKNFSEIVKKTIRYFICFTLSVIIYYVLWKIAQKIFHVWTANTYNGLSGVADYSNTSIMGVITKTYSQVFNYIWNPESFKSIIYKNYSLGIIWKWILRVMNLITLALLLVQIVRKNKAQKTTGWQKILQILLLILLPFGLNFVCFVSKGMEHTLMIYSFLLIYVMAIWFMEDLFIATEQELHLRKRYLLFTISLAVLLWSNIVYANQVYLKKELQVEATLSQMTRVVADIERMPNYIPGETKVAFYGCFQVSDNVPELADFEEIEPYGMGKSSVTYMGADYTLLKYVMNVKMELCRVDSEDEMLIKQVEEMPIYPEQGSIAYIDGLLVVKISNL